MSYAIPDHVTSVGEAVRQIACEQIDKAMAEIDDAGIGPDETIHRLRKRCKKLRALARLVEPHRPSLKRDRQRFRAIAGAFAGLRDAEVLIGAHGKLTGADEGEDGAASFAAIGEELERRRQAVPDAPERLAAARKDLVKARAKVAAWELPVEGFEAFRPGLENAYRGGRAALAAASDKPNAKRLHELRKRAKETWYHLRLLRSHTPDALENKAAAMGALTDLLGEEHDLAVLRAQLKDDKKAFGGKTVVKAFSRLIKARRAALQEEALGLAATLFEDKPKVFVGRFADAWMRPSDDPESSARRSVFPAPAIVGM